MQSISGFPPTDSGDQSLSKPYTSGKRKGAGRKPISGKIATKSVAGA
jgi:hypothetical protein